LANKRNKIEEASSYYTKCSIFLKLITFFNFILALLTGHTTPAIFADYALFLTSKLEKHDEAEEYFKKCLDFEQRIGECSYYYAMFLQDIRKDLEKSEKVFQ
jgi:hypothetical protein